MPIVEVNEWLQDAITDFLREWVGDRIVPKEHPESKGHHIVTEFFYASHTSIKIRWWFNPYSTVSGEVWFTPRDALALFLQHGPSDEDANGEVSDE